MKKNLKKLIKLFGYEISRISDANLVKKKFLESSYINIPNKLWKNERLHEARQLAKEIVKRAKNSLLFSTTLTL